MDFNEIWYRCHANERYFEIVLPIVLNEALNDICPGLSVTKLDPLRRENVATVLARSSFELQTRAAFEVIWGQVKEHDSRHNIRV